MDTRKLQPSGLFLVGSRGAQKVTQPRTGNRGAPAAQGLRLSPRTPMSLCGPSPGFFPKIAPVRSRVGHGEGLWTAGDVAAGSLRLAPPSQENVLPKQVQAGCEVGRARWQARPWPRPQHPVQPDVDCGSPTEGKRKARAWP